MRHRGPDDSFAGLVTPTAAWGMCRLAIRDLSDAGRQPFWHGDTGLIFNGEIYNTDELRAILVRRGHDFSTACDTEVVLKTYVEFGIRSLSMLDGIFAIALVDQSRNELVLARDEFGVKPLFVAESAGQLSFASEPKALDELGILTDIDVDNLASYLRYQYVPEPKTAWQGVRKIERGSAETFSLDSLKRKRIEYYVQPGLEFDSIPSSLDAWIARTEEVIQTSVQRQMISDRPLGVFLSGGIDSTLISMFASEIHRGLQAFGISVPGWTLDERQYMSEASQYLDVDLTITNFTVEDFDRLTDRLLPTYDEPFGDFSALPTMKVAEIAGKDLRVVLSGDGGDELFGGYSRYQYALLAERIGMFPVVAIDGAVGVLGRLHRENLAGRMNLVADERRGGGHGYGAMLALRNSRDANALLGRTGHSKVALSKRANGWWTNREKALASAMAVDIDQYLPADIHTKVDRATMSVSLEARVPLLGGPVARLAATMPTSVKFHDDTAKWPLKEILRRRGFSESFIHRQKTGFSLPINEWLRSAIERRPELAKLLLDPPAPLDGQRTKDELACFMNGSSTGHAIWTLLALSSWLEKFSR